MSFNYKAVKRPDGTEVKTPSIPILLRGKEVIETLGLLDSGADISAIPRDMAELIGLDLNKKKEFAYGIGGRVESVETHMSITVEKGHESYKFHIPVKVIFGAYDFPILLGRAGFFNEFVISFDQSKNKVSLKKVNN